MSVADSDRALHSVTPDLPLTHKRHMSFGVGISRPPLSKATSASATHRSRRRASGGPIGRHVKMHSMSPSAHSFTLGETLASIRAGGTSTPTQHPLANIPLGVTSFRGEVRIKSLLSDPLGPLTGVRAIEVLPTPEEAAEESAKAAGEETQPRRSRCPRRIRMPWADPVTPLDTYVRVTLLPSGIGQITDVVKDSGTKVCWRRRQRLALHYDAAEHHQATDTTAAIMSASANDATTDEPATTKPFERARPNQIVVVNDVASISSMGGGGGDGEGSTRHPFLLQPHTPSSLRAIDEQAELASDSTGRHRHRRGDTEMELACLRAPPPPPPSPPHLSPPSPSHALALHDDSLLVAALTSTTRSAAEMTSASATPAALDSPKLPLPSGPSQSSGDPAHLMLAQCASPSRSRALHFSQTATTATTDAHDIASPASHTTDDGHSSAHDDASPSKQTSAPLEQDSALSFLSPSGPMLLIEVICCSPERDSSVPCLEKDRLVASATWCLESALAEPRHSLPITLQLIDVDQLEEQGQVEMIVQFEPDDRNCVSGGEDDTTGATSGTIHVEVLSATEFIDPFNHADLYPADWGLMRRMLLAVFIYLAAGVAFYVHYEGWSILNAVYFCLVTATTTGYGDLKPSSDESRVFTIFFVLVGIGIIAIAIGISGGLLLERQEQEMYKQLLAERQAKAGATSPKKLWLTRTKQRILWCVVLFNAVVWLGAIGFWYLEDTSFLDAVYLCVITISTVGYGDTAPKSVSGRAFCCPWIVVSTFVMTHVIGEVTDLYMTWTRDKRAELVLKNSVNSVADLAALDDDNSGEVSELEFLKHMLVQTKSAAQRDIDAICEHFRRLDADGSGFLDAEDFKKIEAEKHLRQQMNARRIGATMSVRNSSSRRRAMSVK